MLRVQFEYAAALRDLLMHRPEQPFHMRRQRIALGHQTAGTLGEPRRKLDLDHRILELLLQELHQLGELLPRRLELIRGILVLEVVPVHRLEVLLLVLEHRLHHPVVDGIGHEEHVPPLGAEVLQNRGVGDRLALVAGEEIDVLLTLRHRRHILGQRDPPARLGVHRLVEHQILEFLGVGEVGVKPLLQYLSELQKELLIGRAIGLKKFFELAENFAGHRLFDAPDDRVLLQYLARNVERQIARIDHPADEAQIIRQQLLALVGDEDPLHIELKSLLLKVRHQQIERGLFGQEQQRCELVASLGGEMDGLEVLRAAEV